MIFFFLKKELTGQISLGTFVLEGYKLRAISQVHGTIRLFNKSPSKELTLNLDQINALLCTENLIRARHSSRKVTGS